MARAARPERRGGDAAGRIRSAGPVRGLDPDLRAPRTSSATFARRQGGPGTLALVPARERAEDDPATVGLGADAALAPRSPATGCARRSRGFSTAARDGGRPGRHRGRDEPKLTSHDIFGDLVAEVEREAGAKPQRQAAGRASGPPPAQPAPSPPPSSPSGQPASPPSRPARSNRARRLGRPPRDAGPRRTRVDDDIERRLEQTLSGVLPGSQSLPKDRGSAARPAERDRTGRADAQRRKRTRERRRRTDQQDPLGPGGAEDQATGAARRASPGPVGSPGVRRRRTGGARAGAPGRRRGAKPPAEGPAPRPRSVPPEAARTRLAAAQATEEPPPPAGRPRRGAESAPEAATPPSAPAPPEAPVPPAAQPPAVERPPPFTPSSPTPSKRCRRARTA